MQKVGFLRGFCSFALPKFPADFRSIFEWRSFAGSVCSRITEVSGDMVDQKGERKNRFVAGGISNENEKSPPSRDVLSEDDRSLAGFRSYRPFYQDGCDECLIAINCTLDHIKGFWNVKCGGKLFRNRCGDMSGETLEIRRDKIAKIALDLRQRPVGACDG